LRTGLTVVVPTYKRRDSLARFLDSVVLQDRLPEEVLVVDASPDADTERMLQSHDSAVALGRRLKYWRVSGLLAGLTRQKNFALRHVNTDLVSFFDDDIVLEEGCLREMERVLRSRGSELAGVGCFTEVETPPTGLWRLRHRLGLVPSLQPGTYARSGISIPWHFQPSPDSVVEGDWLPGCAQMVRTAAALNVGFEESFGGYAQGEDLDFSLRLRTNGKLVIARHAHLRHLCDPGGRPNAFRVGYMELYNRYHIHRRAVPMRNWRDVAWFAYAWTVDTALLARHLKSPSAWGPMVKQIAGRIVAAAAIAKDLMFSTRARTRNSCA
jgi:GT2 family glycosyltransferase